MFFIKLNELECDTRSVECPFPDMLVKGIYRVSFRDFLLQKRETLVIYFLPRYTYGPHWRPPCFQCIDSFYIHFGRLHRAVMKLEEIKESEARHKSIISYLDKVCKVGPDAQH